MALQSLSLKQRSRPSSASSSSSGAILTALLILACTSLARAHVIGGGFNTDFRSDSGDLASQDAEQAAAGGRGRRSPDLTRLLSVSASLTSRQNVQPPITRLFSLDAPATISHGHVRVSPPNRRLRARRAALQHSPAAVGAASPPVSTQARPNIMSTQGTEVSSAGSTQGTEVSSAGSTQGTEVSSAGSTQGTEVSSAGSTQGTEVSSAGSTQGTEVSSAGSTQGTEVSSAGSTQGTEVSSAGSTQGTEVSSAGATHPFLRLRRDESGVLAATCSLPANLPAQVLELNEFLQASQYIGVLPAQAGSSVPLPGDQPPRDSCPAVSGSWWPRPEVNLRSTCPWVWEQIDNGPDAYPRYLRQAKCICQNCIGANSNSCQELRHEVAIFRLKSCQNGLAVMERDAVTVTLGCFCAAPEPEGGEDADQDSGISTP